jgi:putative transposase
VLRLRDADRALADGQSMTQVCKTLGISEPTYQRWRKQYSGMAKPQVKRLRELERENERLKRLVADQALDISMLKELAKGNF